jgi:hypothetical protein
MYIYEENYDCIGCVTFHEVSSVKVKEPTFRKSLVKFNEGKQYDQCASVAVCDRGNSMRFFDYTVVSRMSKLGILFIDFCSKNGYIVVYDEYAKIFQQLLTT